MYGRRIQQQARLVSTGACRSRDGRTLCSAARNRVAAALISQRVAHAQISRAAMHRQSLRETPQLTTLHQPRSTRGLAVDKVLRKWRKTGLALRRPRRVCRPKAVWADLGIGGDTDRERPAAQKSTHFQQGNATERSGDKQRFRTEAQSTPAGGAVYLTRSLRQRTSSLLQPHRIKPQGVHHPARAPAGYGRKCPRARGTRADFAGVPSTASPTPPPEANLERLFH